MSSSSSTTFSLIQIFYGLRVIKQLLVTFITYEFELDHVIPSLIGYIIIVLNFNCATWTFPVHKFRQWANLASILLVISLLLEQQTWFRVCVLTVVPITFRFHHSFDLMSSSINYIFLKTSRQICRDHCQQFDFFQVVCWNSGWEIPSFPSMNCVIIDNILTSPQHKLVHILCCILISLLSNLC